MSERTKVGDADRLGSVTEDIIDPDRDIVDPHHHLWIIDAIGDYLLEDLHGDTATHNVAQTMFMECHANYRSDGPDHLRPIGETEWVAGIADESDASDGATIAGIVGHADLTLPIATLDEVLDAHTAAAGGRFRGIRDALARAPEADAPVMLIAGMEAEGKSTNPDFIRGVQHLGSRGLTYDSWHYHYQLVDFANLAAACPDTTMICDHFGTPLGAGSFAGSHDRLFDQWKEDLAVVAAQPNTVAKLGGLAMPDNGFTFNETGTPPTSDEFVAVQGRYYRHAVEVFGPERCMFESNFPVDKWTLSYHILFNALKKIAADYDEAAQAALFAGTARRVYSLPTP